MPHKLKTRCRHRGCANSTRDGYCDEHRRERSVRIADRRRGSAASRGYDAAWRRLRDAYVHQHPFCEECLAEGNHVAGTEVDHVIPIEVRPDLRLDETNLRTLCKRHHKLKTDRDAMRYGAAFDDGVVTANSGNSSAVINVGQQVRQVALGPVGGGFKPACEGAGPRVSRDAHFREIGYRWGDST